MLTVSDLISPGVFLPAARTLDPVWRHRTAYRKRGIQVCLLPARKTPDVAPGPSRVVGRRAGPPEGVRGAVRVAGPLSSITIPATTG